MAARNRADRLTALAGLFEAAFRALAARPYFPRAVESAIVRIAEALVEDLKASGDLTLTVTPQALKAGDVELGTGQMAAAIAVPLVRDALKDITFKADLPMEEALELVRPWVRCSQGYRGTDGVAARVWEMEQPHVTLTRNPPAFALGEKVLSEAEVLGRELTQETVAAIELVHLSDERMTPALQALKAVDLVPETVTTDTAKWVQQVDALGASLAKPRANALLRFVESLVRSAEIATPPEQELLGAVAERLVRSLAWEHRFTDIIDAFRHVAPIAKTESGRTLVLRLRSTLTAPWFMEKIIETLNANEGYDDALNGVRRMGVGAVRSLLAVPQVSMEGKRRLGYLLAELDIDGTRQEKVAAASQVTTQLQALGSLTPDQAREVLKKALASPDLAMRKQALEVMTQAQAMVVVESLHLRVQDPSAEIRGLTLQHLAAIEDPTAVPVLVAQLHRSAISKDERMRLYETLGAIGGPKAGAALTEELQKQADVALKVEAAKALGHIDHPRVREVLEAEAGRLLAPAELRKACKEALVKLGTKP